MTSDRKDRDGSHIKDARAKGTGSEMCVYKSTKAHAVLGRSSGDFVGNGGD